MRVRIGVAGWAWPAWNGRAWPAGTPARQRLRRLADLVDLVEATPAAEAVPSADRLARWRAAVAGRALLALPVWWAIAYGLRLRDARPAWERVVAAALALGADRGPLLLRMPPTLRLDRTLLADALVDFDDARAGADLRLAIEFTGADWLRGDVYRLLDRHGVAACVSDLPGCLALGPNEAPFVYVRRHGPDGGARERYPVDLIARDADDARDWIHGGREVFVVFCNGADGHALDDTAALAASLAAPVP